MALFPRVALVLGGTAAYLALAILGWGGIVAFFSDPARTALAVALAIRRRLRSLLRPHVALDTRALLSSQSTMKTLAPVPDRTR